MEILFFIINRKMRCFKTNLHFTLIIRGCQRRHQNNKKSARGFTSDGLSNITIKPEIPGQARDDIF